MSEARSVLELEGTVGDGDHFHSLRGTMPSEVGESCDADSEGSGSSNDYNQYPQNAPGASAATAAGHSLVNSFPLSIFPIADNKFIICMVGLPGRGKTHVAQRISRYLEFFHTQNTKLFNFSEYRRRKYGRVDNIFFDQSNKDAQKLRLETYETIYAEVKEFLKSQRSGVTILDSTNATYERRQKVMEIGRQTGAKVLWIEVNNDDEESLQKAYTDIIQGSPDYESMPSDIAAADLQARVDLYESCFEPIDTGKYPVEKRYSYIKCDLVDRTYTVHNVRGYLELKIVHFVMNLRTEPHDFYLSRHGQSTYNALGKIGGDSGLSAHGDIYAQRLADFVDTKITKDKDTKKEVPARLWTSTMRRTKETTKYIKQHAFMRPDEYDPSLTHEWAQMRPRAWHHLDELFAGQCDGMTYEEIEETLPEEFARRAADKLAYRYPRGESYLDVIARLEPIIIEMERHREPLLIVGHQGVLRIIYAFYMGKTRAETPYVSIPLHTVTHLEPSAFACKESKYKLYRIELTSDGQDEPNKARSASFQSTVSNIVSAVKAAAVSVVHRSGNTSSSSNTPSHTSRVATPDPDIIEQMEKEKALTFDTVVMSTSGKDSTSSSKSQGGEELKEVEESEDEIRQRIERERLEDAINDPQSH